MSSLIQHVQNYAQRSSVASTIILLSIPLLIILLITPKYRFPANAPKLAQDRYPIVGAVRFFTQRWQFWQNAMAHSSTGHFSFRLGKHPVVGLSGDQARQMFFDSRDLDFAEGYAVLFGQSPTDLLDKDSIKKDDALDGHTGYVQRRLIRLLKPDYINRGLTVWISDIQNALGRLEQDASAITDPFESIYRIVFQLTIRTVGCNEIADSQEQMAKALKWFETIEKSSTPFAIMYPWFPSWAVISRTIAGGRLFMMFQKLIDERKQSGKKGDDPLQYLIDQSDSTRRILEFVIGATFAGLLNSGINAAWIILYLAKNPYWLGKIRREAEEVASKYSHSKDAPLVDRLAEVPLEDWESSFPVLDLCLKDSMRIHLLGTAFRRNVSGKTLPIPGSNEVIPPGAFVTYHMDDVHYNPTIYKNPEEWDPSRYLPERAEDKKRPMAWCGWGQGRHPCLGMRFAKLEMNLIVAFFVAKFDIELAKADGSPIHRLATVNVDGHSAEKPKERIMIKYRTRNV